MWQMFAEDRLRPKKGTMGNKDAKEHLAIGKRTARNTVLGTGRAFSAGLVFFICQWDARGIKQRAVNVRKEA